MPERFRFLSKIEFDRLPADQKWVYLRHAYDELNRDFEALARGDAKLAPLRKDGLLESAASMLRITSDPDTRE